MNNYNISKKTINTFKIPLHKNKLTLHNLNNKRNFKNEKNLLDNMLGKYEANKPMNCVELKQKFKKGVL